MYEKPERKKQYKGAKPEETVGRIRKILESSGIRVREEHHYNAESGIPSCNVCIDNDGFEDLFIGTNGKGMTKEYALASGYAEFMERLQNCILIDGLEFPDAVILEGEDREKACRDFFAACFGKDEKASAYFISNDAGNSFLEFESFDGKEKCMIPVKPLKRLCTSNGMCAGNSRIEAVIQGTSEIFERYAMMRILFDKLTPPDVPAELFEGTEVLEKIKVLEKLGVRTRIKDCSLGMSLPVVGVYMTLNDGRELFHLGADPSPITSLERCITEIFQGVNCFSEAEFHEKEEFPHDRTFWKRQLQYNSWGGNIWPMEISSSDYSWEFKGFEHPVTVSDGDDLEWYLSVLEKNGKKLWIHDSSYLGFPSYFCYVPGMSEMDCIDGEGAELARYFEMNSKLSDARRLPALSDNEVCKFAENYRDYINEFGYLEEEYWEKRFFPYGNFTLKDKGLYFLLSKIFAAGGLNEEAIEYMGWYLETEEVSDGEYEACEEFIKKMSGKKGKMLPLSGNLLTCCPCCGKCGVKAYCVQNAADRLIVELNFRTE